MSPKKRTHVIFQGGPGPQASYTPEPQFPPYQSPFPSSLDTTNYYDNATFSSSSAHTEPFDFNASSPSDSTHQTQAFPPWLSDSQATQVKAAPAQTYTNHPPTSVFLPSLPPAREMTTPLSRAKPTLFPTPLTSAGNDYKSLDDMWSKGSEASPPSSPTPEPNAMMVDTQLSEKSRIICGMKGDRDMRRKAIEDKAADKRKRATNRFGKVLANRINGLPENGLANQLNLAADQMENDGKLISQLENDKRVLEKKVQTLEARLEAYQHTSQIRGK